MHALRLAPWNDLQMLKSTFEKYKDEIGAVIIESIMCDSGPILPDKSYLEGVRKLTKEYGIVLIFD